MGLSQIKSIVYLLLLIAPLINPPTWRGFENEQFVPCLVQSLESWQDPSRDSISLTWTLKFEQDKERYGSTPRAFHDM